MTGSYKEECLKHKRVREGIIDQPIAVHGKKKKIDKPWVVIGKWWITFYKNECPLYEVGNYATEKLAIQVAEKKRREFQALEREKYWVVNVEGLKEWRKEVFKNE